jgi:tetratricopeptide (TPR) repeat protein
LPIIDSALVLNRLVNMHFARREAGRYYLHPADREYAFSTIPNSQQETEYTQHSLVLRAADYFAQARKPRAEWKKLDDLAAQMAEFDLRCIAGDYNEACRVISEIDHEYLDLWGHYHLVIQLHEKLTARINIPVLCLANLNSLGTAYRNIGEFRNSITYFEKGLTVAKKTKNRQAESSLLGNIGLSYGYLGESLKAIKFYEQTLVIAREIRDRRIEGIALSNIGSEYLQLGDISKAMDFYEAGLVIYREIIDREGEWDNIINLGEIHYLLDKPNKAIEFYKQALVMKREYGERKAEAIILTYIGHALISVREYCQAEKYYREAVQIADEILSPPEQLSARCGLAQAYLLQNDLFNARATAESTLTHDDPTNNHSATALHGIIALRQGERETAQEAFTKSIAQADEILAKTPDFYSALDARGLALCGLALCDDRLLTMDRKKKINEAVETFRAARKIAPHAGVVKSVLRLFDELVKCDEEGTLNDVRKAAEGTE